HAGLLRLRELRARALPRDEAGCLLRHRVADLRPQRLERGLRLLPRVVLERPRDHVALAAERALDRALLLADLHPEAEPPQPLDKIAIGLVLEPFGDRGRTIRTDPVDRLQLLDRCAEQAVDRPQLSGQHPG